MPTEKETSAGTEVSAETDGLTETNKPTWKAYTFLGLLTICLITLFTLSIWKTVTDLDEQRNLKCVSIPGNSDMYGLGIRLGVYMQLVVSAFVDSFGNQAYSAGLVASTLWFLFALSVALSMVLYNPDTHSSEVYIIISLGNAVTTVMLNKIVKFNPLTSNESYLLSLGRVLLWGVWRASTSVYWFTLLHSYAQGSDECGTWGWVFFRVDLYGPFRALNKAINVLEWIIVGFLLLGYVIGIIIFCYSLSRIKWDKERPVKVSKFIIAFDYLFVSVGELRQIMYGVNDKGHPLPLSTIGDAEGGHTKVGSVSHYEARLQRHIEALYTEPKSGADQVQGGNETATGTDRGSRIKTDSFLRVYRRCREFMLNNLHAIGFKRIKIPLLLLWDISTVAYTILNVEFSLRMNNIDYIYSMWSVGQLIPAIIGAGGIGVAAAELYVYEREKIGGVRWGLLGVARIEPPPPYDKKTEIPLEGAHEKKPESIKGETSQLERTESPTSAPAQVSITD